MGRMLAKVAAFIAGIMAAIGSALLPAPFAPPPAEPAPPAAGARTLSALPVSPAKTAPAARLRLPAKTLPPAPQRKKQAVATPQNPPPAAKQTARATPPSPATSTPASPPAPAAEKPPADFSGVNEAARNAVINILCTSAASGSFEPLSGSGVVIDPRGVILTNAHVGQYILLAHSLPNDFLRCMARTGSPARTAYALNLLYISPAWVKSNYRNIIKNNPSGTGENDFALLLAAAPSDPRLAAATAYAYLPYATDDADIVPGDPALTVAYPAGFLGGIGIQLDLYQTSSISTINKLFTFGEGTADLIGLGGSVVAQPGSSGGAVVSADGKLIGLIVTLIGGKNNTSGRDLMAISLGHINRSLEADTGLSLPRLLSGDLARFAERFNASTSPALANLLTNEIAGIRN